MLGSVTPEPESRTSEITPELIQKNKTMTTLRTWNPIREMQFLQNRVFSALQEQASRQDNADDGSKTATDWSPVVDIIEAENEFIIDAELPAVKREDVKVVVEDGELRFSGERQIAKDESGRKFHRIERAYGKFSRTFQLPENANPDQVSASFKDGVLSIRVAKQEAVKPREIEVN